MRKRGECQGCGAETARTSNRRCRSCATPARADYSCRDCGTSVHRGSARCRPCAAKLRRVPRAQCSGCGVEVTLGAIRCLSCHNLAQDRGLSRDRTKFNVSDEWRLARMTCFERDDYTCQSCGARGGVELNAHHRLMWSEHPERRLDIDNLTTLCVGCHRGHHAYRRTFDRVCGGGPDA